MDFPCKHLSNATVEAALRSYNGEGLVHSSSAQENLQAFASCSLNEAQRTKEGGKQKEGAAERKHLMKEGAKRKRGR